MMEHKELPNFDTHTHYIAKVPGWDCTSCFNAPICDKQTDIPLCQGVYEVKACVQEKYHYELKERKTIFKEYDFSATLEEHKQRLKGFKWEPDEPSGKQLELDFG